MTSIEFEEYVKVVIEEELTFLPTMTTMRFWDDIVTGSYGFQPDIYELVKDIRPLTKEDVLTFFEVYLLDYQIH